MTRQNFLVGLIGEGIRYSLTPGMHMTEAVHHGLKYEYRVVDCLEDEFQGRSLSSIIDEARSLGFAALNITHPFKQEVIEYLDELSPAATEIGAVNLVLLRDDKLRGENTDWTGFLTGVKEGLTGLETYNVVQFGAGGAGAATAYALLKFGVINLAIFDLDFAKAEALAEHYQRLFTNARVTALLSTEINKALKTSDGVVQATPVGMATLPGVPFDLAQVPQTAWVADVIYRPFETQLIIQARDSGHAVLDGGLMAVGQAAESFRLITKVEPDELRMRAHFLQLLNDDSNLPQLRGLA